MKKITLILLLLGSASTAFGQERGTISILETATFVEQVQKPEVQLIDVRTPEEFQEGHLEDAINVDFLNENFLAGFSKFDKDKPVYIYCRSGKRSGKAAKELSAAGFTEIIDLKGGYLGIEENTKHKNLQKEKE